MVDWDREVVENFHEEWMNDALYPDKTHNASYYVRLEANGMLLDKELFVSLDGHRWFVPVPRIEMSKTKSGERIFITRLGKSSSQISLVNVILTTKEFMILPRVKASQSKLENEDF